MSHTVYTSENRHTHTHTQRAILSFGRSVGESGFFSFSSLDFLMASGIVSFSVQFFVSVSVILWLATDHPVITLCFPLFFILLFRSIQCRINDISDGHTNKFLSWTHYNCVSGCFRHLHFIHKILKVQRH